MSQAFEPPLKGPWPAWTIAAVILGSYGVQSLWLPDLNRAASQWGFVPAYVWRDGGLTLVSAIFLHGGWLHAGMNAIGGLAFGAPVARLLATRRSGSFIFFGFFLVCGVLANLGYALVAPHGLAPVVGASGAVSGLFGAATRLVERRPGLSPLASRTVMGSAAAWVIVNLALGLGGYVPGLGAVQVAWQVHLVGYAVGVFLIAPLARLPGRSPGPEAAEP